MNPALETIALALREHPAAPGAVLFLGAEPHPDLPDLTAWQPLKPLADACTAAGMSLTDEPRGQFPYVLFLPGKSKAEVLAGFARAHGLLAPGGRLIVGLANTAGASRFEKELSRAAPLLFTVSKNKCRAFAIGNETPWDSGALAEWRELSHPRAIPGTDFITAPGVFSAEHIDPGSLLLAEKLPPSLYGCIADLGAGWGYLSTMALEKAPKISRIDLYEADARALACARKNVRGKASFHWHDVTTGIPGKYDHILMNPPFHTGQSKDVDLGKAFLTTAAASLKRGGTIHLVANRQLPYEAHLAALGLRSRIIAEDHAFKVIFSS
ncbi:class I SAM-dependent methyltransferase [Akkermansiaceae bacterium]|nr:class I SAM-dependent methyltransferase [Akkermansiaceae bacterium]